jgi:hypothetical protein
MSHLTPQILIAAFTTTRVEETIADIVLWDEKGVKAEHPGLQNPANQI